MGGERVDMDKNAEFVRFQFQFQPSSLKFLED